MFLVAGLGNPGEEYALSPHNLGFLTVDRLALRIKPKGSAAGHNGMKSVIASLKTSDVARVRMGIHPGHRLSSGADFVLAPIKRSQRKELEEFVDYSADAVRSIIAEGVEKAMTRYNRRAPGLNIE